MPYLLGDPLGQLTVEQWLEQVQAEEVATVFAKTGVGRMPGFLRFELGCAEIYDARHEQAMVTFQALSVMDEISVTMRVLWRLGQSRALGELRKFPRADHVLGHAVAQAERAGDPTLHYVARLFRTKNLSDWGRAPDHDWISQTARPTAGPPRASNATTLDLLLHAFAATTLARVHLRSGDRDAGLAVLDAVIARQDFGTLAAIPRGTVLRLRGILLATASQTAAARADLEDAIGTFREVGYRQGEVQAALSLARTTARTDRQQTWMYLERARQIVDETDPPGAQRPRGRQMPAERADLFSRLGDFKFAAGELTEAIAMYRRDLQVLDVLTGNPAEAAEILPRAAAYAHRSLGRALLTQRSTTDEGVKHLRTSCELFARVGDPINVFFSRTLECGARLDAGDCAGAQACLAQLETLVATAGGRDKERAIARTLRAQLILRRDGDGSSAHAFATQARDDLRPHRDYHYVRALLVEAEILLHMRDVPEARKRLQEARRCAIDCEAEDLRRVAEAQISDLGVPPVDPSAGLPHLRARCQLEGFVRIELTTFFADIRGFTAASAVIQPDVMALFIKEFAEIVGKCISRHGGAPIRFLGDCVMGLFDVEPHGSELAALRAAADIHELFVNLRRRWATRIPDLGTVGIGFGVATGTVVAGTFGTDDLGEFSAIGEPVNRASRLQGVAADGELFMCETTLTRACARVHLDAERRVVELKGLGAAGAWCVSLNELTRAIAGPRGRVSEAGSGPLSPPA
ncbi:MAG: hypothetical protein HY908_05395 [Myxococcales bacterium]|nr:hypothetical protein [Myxococcales bacterium]